MSPLCRWGNDSEKLITFSKFAQLFSEIQNLKPECLTLKLQLLIPCHCALFQEDFHLSKMAQKPRLLMLILTLFSSPSLKPFGGLQKAEMAQQRTGKLCKCLLSYQATYSHVLRPPSDTSTVYLHGSFVVHCCFVGQVTLLFLHEWIGWGWGRAVSLQTLQKSHHLRQSRRKSSPSLWNNV